MLNVRILGPGCHKCHAVEQEVVTALETLAHEYPNTEVTVQHVQDPVEIHKYPILFTPGLVIDEKLVCAGRIPSENEILNWLRAALEEQA